MSKQGRWIEVQIRSDRMNEIAEQGFAAHWKYKAGDEITEDEGELNNWLRTIKEILDDPQPDAMDFLDAIKLNLFASEIFVFTPKGEIKTLPAGCTALDFAFQLHTFLGSHCIGAKVNHRLVPLSHKLQSGDQVEVLTSKSQHVDPSWINFVSTAKARGKIQAILRRDNREKQRVGENILKEWLESKGLELTTSIVDKICELHGFARHEELYQAVGENRFTPDDKDVDHILGKKKTNNTLSWRRYVPFLDSDKKKLQTTDTDGLLIANKEFNKKLPCIITEASIHKYIFPNCCHPIPGDDILGFIDNKHRIEIHKRSCPVANRLKSSFGNRILDAKWDMHRNQLFETTIEVQGIDRQGILRDLSDVISNQLNIDIRNITISVDNGLFNGVIKLRVHDRDETLQIINSLKKIKGLHEAKIKA